MPSKCSVISAAPCSPRFRKFAARAEMDRPPTSPKPPIEHRTAPIPATVAGTARRRSCRVYSRHVNSERLASTHRCYPGIFDRPCQARGRAPARTLSAHSRSSWAPASPTEGGVWDSDIRITDMDVEGVDAQLVVTNAVSHPEPEIEIAFIRALHRFRS